VEITFVSLLSFVVDNDGLTIPSHIHPLSFALYVVLLLCHSFTISVVFALLLPFRIISVACVFPNFFRCPTSRSLDLVLHLIDDRLIIPRSVDLQLDVYNRFRSHYPFHLTSIFTLSPSLSSSPFLFPSSSSRLHVSSLTYSVVSPLDLWSWFLISLTIDSSSRAPSICNSMSTIVS
jgi:hypothetical protein